ncbi:MAG: glycosyltransferase [Rhodobacteraceae bacterium]|nr:glycosyltransferase [Paracoccaceae bacterium]
MQPPSVSVIVVSRGRPDRLTTCLAGIARVAYAPFEIVVVADPQGCAAVGRLAFADEIKLVPFDQPNISAARNAGVARAAGEIIAFIDDDAVPEPTWLSHLAAPFAEADVACAGGHVLGRNGFSLQWGARWVGRDGQAHGLKLVSDAPVVLTPTPDRAIKTEGTNMAVRRTILAEMGGFDLNFHYFHDETDLNLRLADAGCKTALVPRAMVHHGYAASATRTARRVPRDLFQIGASWAVFLRKHCPADRRDAAMQAVTQSERRRALGHMIAGRLEPRDVRRLMASLREGHAAGLARSASLMPALTRAAEGLRPMPLRSRAPHRVLAGRIWSRDRLRAQARDLTAKGHVVTVLLFSPDTRYHIRVFQPEGFWVQRGGLFGKSLRTDPLVRFWRFASRVRRETMLTSELREIPPIPRGGPE